MKRLSANLVTCLALLLAHPAISLERVANPVVSSPVARTACLPSASTLCLNSQRFRVEVSWKDFQGRSGNGTVVEGASEDSGLFWFFDSENWELLVKVLDGCGENGHYWVFAAATTNVEYTLTVTDTQSGDVAQYINSLGTAADAITDAAAFESCP